MKFFFKLILKAGKIANILGYIYTGMLAASSALEVLVDSLPQNKISKLKKALKFITIGSEALRKVLEWFGKTNVIENSENEAREITIKEFQIGLQSEFNGIEEEQ